MKDLWTDDIRRYYAHRIAGGASPNTIGHEVSTLSAIFAVLIDCKQKTGITANPCDHVRGNNSLSLNFASRERSAYWSRDLINAITTVWSTTTRRPLCPEWLSPILWTAYYAGMRLNEVLGLQRHEIHLDKRMMFLTTLDQDLKEGKPKRVPIHRELEPVLQKALKIRAFGIDTVFLISDHHGTRAVKKDTVELAMRRIVKVLNPEPRFSFHDTRHTFKANCRRSGIPEAISERIVGHSDKSLAISERYGEISDQEFVEAIDRLTVNNGISMIDGKPVSLFGNKANRTLEDHADSVPEFQGVKSAAGRI